MKKVVLGLAAVLLVAAIGLLFAGNYFYNVAVARQPKDFLKGDPALTTAVSKSGWGRSSEWLEAQPCEAIRLRSHEGLQLAALYLPASKPTDKTVILAHGYSSQGRSMADFARYYREEMGFNVLLPDARGHGESEGDSIGFGWPDRLDYLQWIDYVIRRNGPAGRIVLHGVSMGGATVLMISGEKLPTNVKLIVADCAYTSVRDILGYQLKRRYHLPEFPLMNITSLICRIRAGYSFEEASALDQVNKSNTPILFIHGDADTFVPVAMVKKLYAAASCEKELLTVAGAGHGESFWAGPAQYRSAVEGFIARYIGD